MPTAIATNAAAVLGIGTSYAANKVIALTSPDTGSGGTGVTTPPPAKGAYMSRIELDVNIASGTPASGTAVIRWDAAGDVACTAELAFTFVAGVTTTTTRLCVDILLDRWYRTPANQTGVPTFYLFIKVNSGTVDVPVGGARLVWTTDMNDQS